MNTFKRLFIHSFTFSRHVRVQFPDRSLRRLQEAVSQSEEKHLGQVRFVVESNWHWRAIWRKKSTRERALEWFGLTRTWDTEDNIGVLIYLSFADKAIEIIADRGVGKKVDNDVWQDVCRQMQPYFADKAYVLGLQVGLDAVSKILATHFPREKQAHINELSDEVIIR